jgi:hypothetical protein
VSTFVTDFVPKYLRDSDVTREIREELLCLAGISLTSVDAHLRLINAIYRARWFAHEWEKVPRPVEQNAVIARVEDAARRLLEALSSLDRQTYGGLRNRFRRALIHEGKNDELQVKDLVGRIVSAAAAAKVNPLSRPNGAKKDIVATALDFFSLRSPFSVSGTGTGKFALFARRFYWAVTGTYPDGEGEGIDRQIRVVVKDSRNTTPAKKSPVAS